MSLAEYALHGREFKTVQMPETFQVYCYRCNSMIRPGELALKYDGATYTHHTCPRTPHKTYAPHKYGNAR